MKYKKKGNKYIFDKRGVFFSLTLKQVDDMIDTLNKIKEEESPKPFYCTIDDERYDDCVIDMRSQSECCEARKHTKKEDCPYWKQLTT